ncbi:MAG TPA: hypothetical protein VHD90_27760 [Phototrophicaceae bacterium]|nr:hypothetical protein [Phototrophicaceae bacterium]
MRIVRSRQGRAIASFIFVVAQMIFWLSFFLLPFSTLSGMMRLRIIIYILQSTLYVNGGLMPSDVIFFAYPLGMLIAFGAWVFKVRRGGLLALLAYFGLLSTGFTTDVGFLICVAMIAICALTVIAE